MIDIEQRPGKLKISYYDKNGQVAFREVTVPKEEQFEWVIASDGKRADPVIKNWDGRPVRKNKTTFLNKYRMEEFLMTLPEDIQKEIYQFNTPKKFYVDIETEFTDGGINPEAAKGAVLSIGFCNEDDLIVVMGTKEMSKEDVQNVELKIKDHFKENKHPNIRFKYIYFKSEYDMLYSFFAEAIRKMPLITGWNFIGFDWTYLINRARRLNIDPGLSSVSGELGGKNKIPVHRMIVDYLEIYKKYDTTIKMKENNSLDAVALAALEMGKVKYGGALWDLPNTNYPLFVYYNAVDAFLVRLIDEKLNTLETFLRLGYLAQIEANRAFSPVWFTEAMMTRPFLQIKNRIMVDEGKRRVKEKYPGGYVKDPIPGYYRAIGLNDFASLYPSILRQWNVSPETFVRMDPKGCTDPLPEGYIRTASGAVFDNRTDGVMRLFVSDLFDKRKETKGEMKKIVIRVEELKKEKERRLGLAA